MAAKRLVVAGASSGGLEALQTILSGLPADFPAPFCVVVHTAPQSPGTLDRILARAGSLAAVLPTKELRLRPGHIYVAPPDHHLLVEPGLLKLSKGPKENRFRPAVDPLFRTAAQVYGPAAIGIVLSGNLDDGTAGLWVLKQLGGIAIVQAPDDALFPSMPKSAIQHVEVDYVVPAREIPALLMRLVASPIIGAAHGPPESLEVEVRIAAGQNAVSAGVEQIGEPSAFACPECHGVLLHLKGSQPLRFRCHTGHAYSATSLAAAMNEGIEDALWTAVRALEEGALLLRHLSQHQDYPDADSAGLATQAEETHRASEDVRQVANRREALRSGRE